AFALTHVDYSSRGIDLTSLQVARLTQPQSRRVQRGEEDPVLRRLQRIEQLADLLLGQYLRQPLRILRPRQKRDLLGACQRLAVQKLQRREVLSESLRSRLALLQLLYPGTHHRLVALLRGPAELCE